MTATSQLVPRPISICATGLTATVKRVKFLYNGTDPSATEPSLSDLPVVSVSPVTYAGGKEKPLWAVENPGAGFNLAALNAIWGIVDGKAAPRYSESISTLRAESLPLPASAKMDDGNGHGWGDSMVSLSFQNLLPSSIVHCGNNPL